MSGYLKKIFPYFPIVGILTYCIFFFIAIEAYPGGSINDLTAIGYSHFHNFLCDINHKITLSGSLNHGRPLGIVAHLFLSAAIISFFYLLPEIFQHKNRNTKLIRQLGVLTFVFFILMFTEYHDYIVFTTGVLGTSAMIPYFIELKKYPNKGFVMLSYTCFIAGVIVFIMFFSKLGFYYLPFVEKIAFVIYSAWIFWVSFIVAGQRRNS